MIKLLKNTTFWVWFPVLFLGLVIFAAMQYHARGHFSDPDGFYHARSSQMLVSGEIKSWDESQNFPWLYFTTWNEGYANQHYLYHWLLAPFNTIEKLPISIVVFGLIFIIAFTAVLQKYKIQHKWFWVLVMLVGSIDFLFRINLVKANTVSLALLCVITLLIYSHHKKQNLMALFGVIFTSGIFVWTYGGFVCVPLLLGAYGVSEIISQKSLSYKVWLKAFLPLMASLIGILLGMLLHPQSHNLWTLIYDQLFRTGLGAGLEVPAGNEWLPFNLNWFIKSNVLVLFVWLFSLSLFICSSVKDLKSAKNKTLTMWLQITAIGLMCLTLWHRRFVEYWVPFAILSAAVTLQSYISAISWESFVRVWRMWQIKIAVLLIAVIFIGFGYYTISSVEESLISGESVQEYKEASQWLSENSEAGDIVLNTQWDQFPQLFYFNSKNYYILGLDPTFMYIHDKEKYWKWRLIVDDDLNKWESYEQLHKVITQDLKAKYVLVDKIRNPNILNYLSRDVNAKTFSVYDNNKLVILKITK